MGGGGGYYGNKIYTNIYKFYNGIKEEYYIVIN